MHKTELLALSQIAKKELSRKQMQYVKGGKSCTCGCCYYANEPDPSTNDAGYALCLNGSDTSCPWIAWEANC